MPRVTAGGNEKILSSQTDILELARIAFQSAPTLPSIVDFAEHPSFLGTKDRRLYPRQKTLLKLMFLETENMTQYDLDVIDEWSTNFDRNADRIGISPDIWDRITYLKEKGFPHFREVINITGRRGGKGHLGAIVAAYQMYRLITLDNPQWYYGVAPDKALYLYTTATNIDQARKFQFADILNVVRDSPCFRNYIAKDDDYNLWLRSPADFRRIAEFESMGQRPQSIIASIRAEAVSSNSSSSRGAACFTVIFDEMAHMITGTEGPRTAEEVYNAITPALDQFGQDGMIMIPTSPYSKIGRAYNLYEDSLAINPDGTPMSPNMLLIQLPSWGPYEDWDNPRATGGFEFKRAPQMYDEQMKALEKREPVVFRVERMSQWAEVVDAFLNPVVVDHMYDPFYDGEGKLRVISETPAGQMRYLYRGHCDPSETTNNTACIIAHTEVIKDRETGEEWYHVITDWIKLWKPEDFKDHQIDWGLVEREIAAKILMFPTLRVFSYDQFGSFVTGYSLKRELEESHHKVNVKKVTFTAQSKQQMAERLRSSLGMGWVHCYPDGYGNDGTSLLADELKFWQIVNGRIKKQNVGPIQTDDLGDCLLVVVDELLEDNFRRLETRERLGSTKLLYDSQGGYSSQNLSNENMSVARRRLAQFGQHQTSVRPLYSGISEKRRGNQGKPPRRSGVR